MLNLLSLVHPIFLISDKHQGPRCNVLSLLSKLLGNRPRVFGSFKKSYKLLSNFKIQNKKRISNNKTVLLSKL